LLVNNVLLCACLDDPGSATATRVYGRARGGLIGRKVNGAAEPCPPFVAQALDRIRLAT
jgi:hypothetical protein